MRKTIRTSAILFLSAATVVAGPALTASAHGGKGARSEKSATADGAKARKGGRHVGGVIPALVAAGTITQVQGDAIIAAFQAARPTTQPAEGTGPKSDAERRAKVSAVLAPLVTNGTIRLKPMLSPTP
jgi:class 3 adenylate cyclase